MWTLDNWRVKRRCNLLCFFWKMKLYGYRSHNREVLSSLFWTKGLSRPVPACLSSTTPLIPAMRCAGVWHPQTALRPHPHATQILDIKSAVFSHLLLCPFSPCVPLPCVLCAAAEDPTKRGSSKLSAWWVWNWRTPRALAPRGEFWSMLLQLIKEMGQVCSWVCSCVCEEQCLSILSVAITGVAWWGELEL